MLLGDGFKTVYLLLTQPTAKLHYTNAILFTVLSAILVKQNNSIVYDFFLT